MQYIFSNLCFTTFFITQVWHWANLNCKENNTSDIRYHEITLTILQIGTPDKRKPRKGSVTKKSHPLKAMQKCQTWFLCTVFLIIIMRLFHVKRYCVKDLIKHNRWQNKASSLTSKRHHLVKCAMIYGCFGSTDNQIPKENNRLWLQTSSWEIKLFSFRNVRQRDCKIMMTSDLNFWLLLCSREEFYFRNVYFSMLVGTKQLYTSDARNTS